MERKIIEISWGSLWRIVLIIALIAALFVAKQAVFIFLLSLVLASALEPIVNFLEKRHFPRILAILLIFIIGLAVLAILLYTIIPITFIELKDLFRDLEEKLPEFLKPFFSFHLFGELKQGNESFINVLLSGSSSFWNLMIKLFGGIVFLIAVFILTFYLLVSKHGVETFLRAILPENQEERVINVYLKIRKKLGYWLQSQLLLSVIVAGLSLLGLWLLGVKYSLLLAVLAGILELVPMAGPIISGAIAFFVALSHSWILGVYVIILFVAIQQLEAHVLLPAIIRKTMGVNPAVVVLALLAGYAIASWIGVVLAVPAAVTLQEIINDFSRHKAISREKHTAEDAQ